MQRCAAIYMVIVFFAINCNVCSQTFNGFDLKSLTKPSAFQNDLKMQAALNSEINRDLMKLHYPKEFEDEKNIYAVVDPNMEMAQIKEEQENAANEAVEELITPIKSERGAEQPSPSEVENFVGTNLFDGHCKKCFTSEEIALLTARKDFEMLIPKDLPQCLLDDKMVSILLLYFYRGHQILHRMTDKSSKELIEKAFYDTLGGYLKHYLVPVTKLSFYAGQVNMKTAQNVINLYQQCKTFLNTNGNGWKPALPNMLNELKNVRVEPVRFSFQSEEELSGSCTNLDLSSVNSEVDDEQMIVPLPKLEPEDCDGYLGNIWLPFKRKRTYNLRSPKSASTVVKFFKTVTGCYRFQGICQDSFNHKFKAWILENLHVHLGDEQFYPGLGGVLKIYENLQRGKKSISVDDQSERTDEEDQQDVEDQNENEEVAEQDSRDSNKRQKSIESKMIAHAANKMEREKNLFEEPFAAQNSEYVDSTNYDKRKHLCKSDQTGSPKHKKPACKSKKPKCKPKKKKPPAKEHWHFPNLDNFLQKKYLKYVLYILALILLLLLLLIFCSILCKCLKNRKPSPPPCEPPACPHEKKIGFCQRFACCRRKKKKDEEIIVKPDSKSVLASEISTSSSSLACHPKAKCIPCARKGQTQNTSRSDKPYCASSSDTKQKENIVAVNEKKNKTAPTKPPRKPARDSSTASTASTASTKSDVHTKNMPRPKKKAPAKSNKDIDAYNTSSAKPGLSTTSTAKTETPSKPAPKRKTGGKTSSWETIYSS